MRCAIGGCNSDNQSKQNPLNKDIKFHRFPKNADLCKQWLQATKRKDKINVRTAAVCSKHFLETDYKVNIKHKLLNYSPKCYRGLKDDAVPTQSLYHSRVSSVSSTSQLNRKVLCEKRKKAQVINEILLAAKDTMHLTLYAVSDGPPSLAVRQALKYLDLDHNLVNVDFGRGDHMTEAFAQKNPQKEIPVLDDNGFFLSESNAILQYLAEKYGKDEYLYPKDPQTRAIVNQRLCFNLSTYYRYISEHVMAPIFFDYQRTPLSLKKTNIALDNYNEYLKRLGKKYAAGDHVTIADFQLVTATMCLEAIKFDLSSYPYVKNWYGNYKKEYPELWKIVEEGMKEISEFEKNPPDLTHMDHPIHPIKRKL